MDDDPDAEAARSPRVEATPAALASLVKPRIVALLSLTGVCATLAAGGLVPARTLAFVLAGAAIAGGSAALNCWYDRDLDRYMARTRDRPLPSGDLDHRVALAFALALLVAGTAVALVALPAVSLGFMWLGVASYVGLYTVGLKRRHWLGVVLGGSAGAFPVLAGWSAVRPVGPAALAMAALVFAWTPAHAWALAAVYRDDFAAADVPTLPVVASRAAVRRATWRSALLAVAVAFAVVPLAGHLYAAVVPVAAVALLVVYAGFLRYGGDPTAVRAFFTSNGFLAVVFAAWAADGLLADPGAPTLGLAVLLAMAAFAWLWIRRPALRGVRSAPPSLGRTGDGRDDVAREVAR